MPHFTIPIGPGGPLFDAWVGVSQAKGVALKAANLPVPNLQKARALLDTGASCTCIDPGVLNALALTPKGTTKMVSPTTGNMPQDVNTYDVSIFIPGVTSPPHVLQTLEVAECQLLQQQGFHVLIGRDILGSFIFHYNGPLKLISISY